MITPIRGVDSKLCRDVSKLLTDLALVAELAHGGVPAVNADPGLWVTRVRVSITLALPAVGEVPVAGLTLRASPTKGGLVSVTLALACLLVTELVLRALK